MKPNVIRAWWMGGAGLVVAVLVGACLPGTGAPGGDVAAGKSLVANLRGADGAEAEVEFREADGHTEFALAIRGGQPGAVVEVTVGGVVVLSVTLDDFGNARVEFDSHPDKLGEDALPASFPGADGGDSVSVGDLDGNFEDKDDGNDNQNDDADEEDDGVQGNELELEAELAASDSSLRVKVKFEAEGDRSQLEVVARGGAPGSTLDVIVGGVTMGTLTLDAYGSARAEFDSVADDANELPFPVGFVAPVAGSAVSVGPLAGTFNLESDDIGDDDSGNENDNADDNVNDNDAGNVNDNGGIDNTNGNVSDDNANDNVSDDNTNDNGP